jgi:hypothetical protein
LTENSERQSGKWRNDEFDKRNNQEPVAQRSRASAANGHDSKYQEAHSGRLPTHRNQIIPACLCRRPDGFGKCAHGDGLLPCFLDFGPVDDPLGDRLLRLRN